MVKIKMIPWLESAFLKLLKVSGSFGAFGQLRNALLLARGAPEVLRVRVGVGKC
jgi:hypothetical protein